MRKLFPGVVLAFVMMGVCLLPARPAESGEPPKAQPAATLDQVLDANDAVCAQEKMSVDQDQGDSIVYCGMYQGTPCTGESRPRCFLQPGEPALCFCIDGYYECS